MAQENVERLRAALEALQGDSSAREWEGTLAGAWVELWDPEIEWDASTHPLPDLAGVYRGVEQTLGWWREWLAAWETVQVDYELVDAGDRVVGLFSQRMRGHYTGIDVVSGRYGMVFSFRDGLIVHAKFHPRPSEALAAVGLRFVQGPDRVRIASEVSGEGPPLVLVHGAGSARWSFDAVRPHLESRFTVIAIDRRGRGDSSDGDGYALEREFEDVAAVVRDAGEGALLMGHSYGGLVAAGAARLFDPPRLALYEPVMDGALSTAETIDRWDLLIAEGDRDSVLREFFRDIAGYDDEAIEELTRSPIWEARRRVVPTLPRELRAALERRFDAADMARLTMPVLLLVGTESPAWAVRSVAAHGEAIPGSETRSLAGQGHSANMTAPDLLAAELERFFTGT
jgi:pimeloyl-ACP methyl ester carboxylesterase